MRSVWMLLSFVALAAMVGTSLLTAAGILSGVANRWGMLLGTLLWFLTAPLWMLRARRRL